LHRRRLRVQQAFSALSCNNIFAALRGLTRQIRQLVESRFFAARFRTILSRTEQRLPTSFEKSKQRTATKIQTL
jgi:hypothetical protein